MAGTILEIPESRLAEVHQNHARALAAAITTFRALPECIKAAHTLSECISAADPIRRRATGTALLCHVHAGFR